MEYFDKMMTEMGTVIIKQCERRKEIFSLSDDRP